jgi:hypothetical protein
MDKQRMTTLNIAQPHSGSTSLSNRNQYEHEAGSNCDGYIDSDIISKYVAEVLS